MQPLKLGSYKELKSTTVDSRIIFVPSLSAVLLAKEKEKGSPLSKEEVEDIRNISTCFSVDSTADVEEGRNYKDIDPKNVWEEWCALREELSKADIK